MKVKKSEIDRLYEAGVAYYEAPSSNDYDEHRAYVDVSCVDKLCEVLGVLGIEVDYDA